MRAWRSSGGLGTIATLALFTNFLVVVIERLQLFIGELFYIDQLVVRATQCVYQLVQLQVNSFRVTVLRVLDKEHHQERDNRRSGVDYQLPGVRVMKLRSAKT